MFEEIISSLSGRRPESQSIQCAHCGETHELAQEEVMNVYQSGEGLYNCDSCKKLSVLRVDKTNGRITSNVIDSFMDVNVPYINVKRDTVKLPDIPDAMLQKIATGSLEYEVAMGLLYYLFIGTGKVPSFRQTVPGMSGMQYNDRYGQERSSVPKKAIPKPTTTLNKVKRMNIQECVINSNPMRDVITITTGWEDNQTGEPIRFSFDTFKGAGKSVVENALGLTKSQYKYLES